MDTELFIAVVAGLGGMLGWGFADFFAKKTIGELGDVMTLAWAGVFGTAAFFCACAYAVYYDIASVFIPSSPTTWLQLIFFGALQAAVYIFAYRGFGKGQVGLLAPVFASFSGFVALVSIFFLGEHASAFQILALAIVFAGILLLNADLSAFGSMRVTWNRIEGLPDVLIATCLAAIWTVMWEQFVSKEDWLFFALYMFIFMTISVFAFAFIKKLSFSVSRTGLWKFIVAIGVCETVAYIAITLGYGATSYTSIVAILSGAFALPTILLARIFLGERATLTQTVASLIIVGGTIVLTVV